MSVGFGPLGRAGAALLIALLWLPLAGHAARAGSDTDAPLLETSLPDGPGPGSRFQQRLERRRERLQRFLDALPEAERQHYEQRIQELERGRDSFAELSPAERDELRAKWRALRDELQGRRWQARQELRSLPPAERRELVRKLRRFRDLPESEQRALRERYHLLQELTPAERERLRENARRWNEMSPERRERLRAQQQRLRALPPEERQQLLETLRDRRRSADAAADVP